MSNFDDDLDLDLEVDIDFTPTGELDSGFEMQQSSNIAFIEDDILGTDEIAIVMTSSGLIGTDLDEENTLLIDYEEIDIDGDLGVEEETFAVALSPAQTALTLYKPHPDESFLIETSNREIHNALYDIGQYEREAYKRLREYLDSAIFDMLPKTVRFKSQEFRKQQDFRSLLISDFLNHRAIPNDYTEQHIIDKVFAAYEAERLPELLDSEIQALTQLIHNFVLFANSTFDEAERRTQLAEYKEFPKTLACPEAVGNFTYVCKCGTEYPMPEGRPTLTFFIRELSKTPIVNLMNHPIPCEKCKVYLTLPTPLVDALNTEMQEYVKRIKATYEQPRIYRPKLDDLKEMIPSDVQDLFQLSGEVIVESSTVKSSASRQAFTNYKKLIGMWMNTVTSQNKLQEVMKTFSDSKEVLTLAKQLTLVDFGFVADLYAHQFAKTIIHYLEGFSCFALTKESQAYYEYCKMEGFNKQAFPVEYAKKWIYDNAPYVASLTNIYSGDTKMTELHILPEYLDAINYVISLHLLSKPELLEKGTDLAKWVKKPTASLKNLEKIYKKFEPSSKEQLVLSHRDLVNTTKVYDPACWSDTHTFLKTIVAPRRYSLPISPDLKALATKAMRQSAPEFYGEAIPDKIVVKPTLRFNEFMTAFKECGYLLFTGAIVDEVRKNLAKGIELFRKADMLSLVFKSHDQSVTDISTILLSPPKEELDEKRLLFELIIKVADLPGELNNKRDEFGYKDILANLEEHKDELTSDAEFMNKYGEVLECYL